MASMEKHIKELIYLHDCVIIPGFGAFVSRHEFSGIHPVTHTFTPPHKIVSFNEQLQHEDELLARHIAEQNDLSLTEAREKLDIYVRKLVLKLNTTDYVLMDGLGSFSMRDKQLSFRFSAQENLSGNSFGLGSFQSPAISRETFEANIKAQLQDKEQIRKSVSGFNWRAAAIIIPLLGLSIAAGLKREQLNDMYSSYAYLNPFSEKPEAAYTPREEFTRATFEIPSISSVHTPETSTRINTEVEISNPISTNIGNYYLIAGCFSSEKNALAFSKKLGSKSFQSEVVGLSNKGLYRVSIGQYPSKEDAISQIPSFKEKGYQVWVLKN